MKEPNPLISVIIPTQVACWEQGREGKYFRAALKSALSQSYEDYEVIVVHPANVRGATRKGCPTHNARVRFVPSNGSTVGASRNAGVKAMRGDWIAFLDSDDLWFPHKLLTQIEFIHHTPKCDLVHSDAIAFRRKKKIFEAERLSSIRCPVQGRLSEEKIHLSGYFLVTSSLMMRKRVLEETGYFDESLWAYEDDEFLVRASHRAPYVGYVPEPLVLFRIKREGAKMRFLRRKARNSLTRRFGYG